MLSPVSAPCLAGYHLEKSYGTKTVVSDVSLHVKRGEIVGLLGPNGAGKTTCFYIMTGLVHPSAGRIVLDGQDVTAQPIDNRARLGLGYLPQESSIFRGLTVAENIMAILEITEPKKSVRQKKLDRLLEEFKLTALKGAKGEMLSGGERRRTEIARALAADPAYILLDEPLAGIDPIAVADIRDLVHQLKNRGLGVLITDHNVRETLAMVDRAYILHKGQVLREGTPQQIIHDPAVKDVYLGESFA
jgi:lipopolysaccharide export system ATP-binding protein